MMFWGEDSFSNVVLQSLLRAGLRVLAVMTPYYDNNIYKRLEVTCKANAIPFCRFTKINSPEVYDFLLKSKPDLCVVAHFEKLIPESYLSLPALGFINLHPSLLPYYRGMSPQHWPIINGERETGVSVHYIDAGVDTGDILIQERIPLMSDMYVSDLQNKWLSIYSWIVVEAVERILRKSPVIKQRDLQGTYYGRLKERDCQIKKEMSVWQAYNLVRGVSLPYRGAEFEGVRIFRVRLNRDDSLTGRFKNEGIGLYNTAPGEKLLRLRDGILMIEKYKCDERENS